MRATVCSKDVQIERVGGDSDIGVAGCEVTAQEEEKS